MTDQSNGSQQKESESSQQASERWSVQPPPPAYELEPPRLTDAVTQPDAHATPSHMRLPAPFSLSRPFPPTMNAYANYDSLLNLAAMLKSFKICNGNNKSDVLFTAEINTGLIPRAPLGSRPGIILHQGPTHKIKDAVIAATGQESAGSGGYLHFNPRSAVILPPPSRSDRPPRPEKTTVQMATETLRAVRLEGPGGQVGFDISMVLVGPGAEGQQWRVGFQWRKKEEGYEMVRLGVSGVSGGRVADGGGKRYDGDEDEVVALLKWPGHALGWVAKMFSLELKGSALSGALGERCVLMILITACRIWMLRSAGKTTKGYVAAGEKTHRKEARGQDC